MSLPITHEIPASFLKEEIRCGYSVSTKLKKVWAVELDLLKEFDRVCRENGIHYQVFAGTLLGAIRHKGFIPWDDDLDVCISRADFGRLKLIGKSAFKDPYFLQTAESDNRFFCAYARLRNSKTTGAISNNMAAGYNNGIYIDIYVLDGYVENRLLFLTQLYVKFAIVKCLTLYWQDRPRNQSIKERLLRFPRPVIRMFPYSFWIKVYEYIAKFFNEKCDRMCEMSEYKPKGLKYWLLKSEFENSMLVDFEDMKVPVAKEYDVVLSRIYGDYKKFPEPSLRGKWHAGAIHFEPEMPYEEFLSKAGKMGRN